MASRHRSALTLIELLVVIAIIAILAAILFPVFARARRAASQTVCVSNARQIAVGIQLYVQDYDEREPRAANNASVFPRLRVSLPPATGDSALQAGDNLQGRPAGFLTPFTGHGPLWRCPQDPVAWDGRTLNTNGSLAVANATSYHLSLFLTGTLVDGTAETTSGDGLPLSAVSRPTQTIVARDGDASDGTNVLNNTSLGGALVGEQLYTRHSDHTQAVRHFGKGNYVMLDGHVKTLAPEWVSPVDGTDDPVHPCPSCSDMTVNINAQAFWNIVP